jgi:hypothetical protein
MMVDFDLLYNMQVWRLIIEFMIYYIV